MERFMEMLHGAFFNKYVSAKADFKTVFFCLGISVVVGVYIYFVYRKINRNSFYNPNFALSLIELSIITASVILTVQTSLAVGLGTLGAFSIIRFRTAIKDPLDLVFLFWSITAGIICGAGLAIIALIMSGCLTLIILLISVLPHVKSSTVLVINSREYDEKEIKEVLSRLCKGFKIRARSITDGNVNYAIEVNVSDPEQLLLSLRQIESITSLSLLEHNGDVTA